MGLLRLILWLIRIAVFVVFVAFASFNMEETVVNLFLGYYLHAPLAMFLLGSLLIGVLIGVLMLLPTVLRKRFESGRLRKELAQHQKASQSPPVSLPEESEASAPLGH